MVDGFLLCSERLYLKKNCRRLKLAIILLKIKFRNRSQFVILLLNQEIHNASKVLFRGVLEWMIRPDAA